MVGMGADLRGPLMVLTGCGSALQTTVLEIEAASHRACRSQYCGVLPVCVVVGTRDGDFTAIPCTRIFYAFVSVIRVRPPTGRSRSETSSSTGCGGARSSRTHLVMQTMSHPVTTEIHPASLACLRQTRRRYEGFRFHRCGSRPHPLATV